MRDGKKGAFLLRVSDGEEAPSSGRSFVRSLCGGGEKETGNSQTILDPPPFVVKVAGKEVSVDDPKKRKRGPKSNDEPSK